MPALLPSHVRAEIVDEVIFPWLCWYIHNVTRLGTPHMWCSQQLILAYWFQMSWCQINAKSSATTMLNKIRLSIIWNISSNIHVHYSPQINFVWLSSGRWKYNVTCYWWGSSFHSNNVLCWCLAISNQHFQHMKGRLANFHAQKTVYQEIHLSTILKR